MVRFLTKAGTVEQHLLTLVRYCGIQVQNNIAPVSLSRTLQEKWIVRNGSARDGLPPKMEEYDLLADLGFYSDSVVPLRRKNGEEIIFDRRILVLGTTHLPTARSRIEFLDHQYSKIPSVPEIHLLTSRRPISKETVIETSETFFDKSLQTINEFHEDTFMEFVSRKLMSHKTCMFTPIVSEGADVGDDRAYANTGDTILTWQRKSAVVKGNFLIFSSQPTLGYQLLLCKRLLHNLCPDVRLYGIGPAAHPLIPMKYFLDVIARQLFEEIQYRDCLGTQTTSAK
ncbi:MAG TPA: hypothetical protein PLF31_00350 [Candidatus Paceibacterota bacterium]|nr:hypothetical protein [Candidatus Paceibacterota bacterium]